MEEARPLGTRISVRGTSGTGKSTLARRLSREFGLRCVELDAMFHQANWQEIGAEEFRRRLGEIVVEDRWVIDGNYSVVQDLVLARCDTVIWLDYPLAIVLWRLNGRIFRRGLWREELWNGNRESLWRHLFTRDSLYLWVLQTNRRRREQADAFFADPAYAGLNRLRFRHPRELAAWLAQVPRASSP